MSVFLQPGYVRAHANRGRWVAVCFYCDNAEQLERMADGFICSECKHATGVVWPDLATVLDIERLLLMRPSPKNQNWLPHETLHDLLRENMDHGILGLHAGDADVILAIVGDRIVTDNALTMNPRRELN